jgi:hypothetical protein
MDCLKPGMVRFPMAPEVFDELATFIWEESEQSFRPTEKPSTGKNEDLKVPPSVTSAALPNS